MENSTAIVNWNNYTNATSQPYIVNDFTPSNTISQFIYDYLCPILAIIGILCNVITLIVLMRPPINGISVSIYFKAYCIAAILTWIFIIGLNWIFEKSRFTNFQHFSQISCRFWSFLTSVMPFAGFWFLTGAAFDRVFLLWTPIKAQTLCTGFMAKNAVVFILIGMTVVSIHAMWMYDLSVQFGCYFVREQYFNRLWMWTSGFLMGCLPLLSLFILGNMIIIRLCLKHHGRQIPDLSKIEMDITYTVMLISVIIFSCAMPSNVLYFLQMYDGENGRSLWLHAEFATYISWVCYLCVFFVLICRCSAFRDALRDVCKECLDRLRRKNRGIELTVMKKEYDQVPSTSTSV